MDYSMKDLKNAASLIQKSVFGKKSEYELKFNHEADGCWYVDFPGWPFDHQPVHIAGGTTSGQTYDAAWIAVYLAYDSPCGLTVKFRFTSGDGDAWRDQAVG